MTTLAWIFDTTRWPPRWQCGTWEGGVAEAMIAADVVMFAVYTVIPIVFLAVLHRRPALVPDLLLARLGVAFVLACGLAHALAAATFWWPAYHFSLVLKLATAVLSVWFAGRLWAVRRRLLDAVTPAQYRAVIAERDAALAATAARNRDLEQVVAARERHNARLQAAVLDARAALDARLGNADLEALRARFVELQELAAGR